MIMRRYLAMLQNTSTAVRSKVSCSHPRQCFRAAWHKLPDTPEIGSDLSRFPSCEHSCPWLTLAPGIRISGDKRLSGRTAKSTNHAGQALRLPATRKSQSFIDAADCARLRRLDKPRAIKATAHQLARLIYVMMTRGEAYVERGITEFEQARRDRQICNLKRNAHALGFSLIDQPIQLTI